jgi:hypothetical protein
MRSWTYSCCLIVTTVLWSMPGLCLTMELPAGVTVHVPEGWALMPPSALDAHSLKLAQLGRPDGQNTYDCGLQLSSATTNTPYPYMLVQVKRTGRVGRSEIAEFKVMQEHLADAVAAFEKTLSPTNTGSSFGTFVFDAPANILWLPAATANPEGEPLRGLLALVLTEQGAIHVACYSRDTEFPAYFPLFETFVRQLTPGPALAYHPRFSDAHPVLANMNWRGLAIPGLIVLVLGAAVLRLVRRASP